MIFELISSIIRIKDDLKGEPVVEWRQALNLSGVKTASDKRHVTLSPCFLYIFKHVSEKHEGLFLLKRTNTVVLLKIILFSIEKKNRL